jgi:transcriptional regulator with XRE-family HTH domain
MKPFYEELKALREQQDIDLAEIQNRTKINQKFLTAIEEGQFDVLPLPYIRLFLRAYVTEIGGNPDEAITQLERYLSEKEGKPVPKKPPETVEAPPPPADKKPLIIKSARKLRSNIVMSSILLVVWIFALIIIRKITLESDAEITDTPTSTYLNHGIEIIDDDKLRSDYVVFSTRDEILDIAPPYAVKIITTSPVGFQATQDTLATVPITLPAGDQTTFAFQDELNLLFNHSNGINIYINGEAVPGVYSHPHPVRVIFSSQPPKITIKHYTPID